MRNVIWAAICAAVFTTTANASPTVAGYIEAFADAGYETAGSSCKTCTYSSHDQKDLFDLGVSGHANILWDTGFGLQADLSRQDRNHGQFTYTATGGGIHFYKRSAHILLGGFVSIGDPIGDRLSNVEGYHLLTGGLESQLNFGRYSLEGQISYSAALQGNRYSSGPDGGTFNAHIGGSYFLTDNFRIGVSGGAAIHESGNSTQVYDTRFHHLLQWQAGVEYELDEIPLSFFSAYQGSNLTDHSSMNGRYAYSANRVILGIRYYFGSSSLRDTNVKGPSLTDYNPWYGATPVLGRAYVY